MPLEAYEYPKTELIVPLMALTEAQVVILYFFILPPNQSCVIFAL